MANTHFLVAKIPQRTMQSKRCNCSRRSPCARTLWRTPTNPVNPTRANPTDADPTDANLKPNSKYVIQSADFIFWRKPQLKIRGKRIYCAFNCHTLGQPLFIPRFVSYLPRALAPYLPNSPAAAKPRSNQLLTGTVAAPLSCISARRSFRPRLALPNLQLSCYRLQSFN